MTRYLPFSLTLEAPALFPELGSNPNATPTLRYVPGSSVRGAMAAALLARDGSAGTPAFHRLILNGQTCWLNAYPLAGERRAFPVPAGWRVKKSANLDQSSTSVTDMAAHTEDDWPSESLRPLAGKFVTLDSSPHWTEPATSWNLHVQMSRSAQRATREEGAIFNYESLDGGQRFQGLVALCGSDPAEIEDRAREIRELLGDRLWLGRSRVAGYGGWARLQWHALQDRELVSSSATLRHVRAGETFTVLLTSDYVGRHPLTGAWDGGAFEDEVKSKLDSGAERLGGCQETRLVGGFNRKWGMELPQATALAAGSLLILRASRDIAADEILTFEQAGLGERRSEGFGRVLLLRAPESMLTIQRAEARGSKSPRPQVPIPPLVFQIEKRIREQRGLREARQKGLDAAQASSAGRLPRGHLISRLRTLLRDSADGSGALVEWLAKLENESQKPAWKALRQYWVRGATLVNLLQRTLGGEEVCDLAGPLEKVGERGAITGQLADAKELEQLERRMRLEYVTALLHQLSRRARNERQMKGVQ